MKYKDLRSLSAPLGKIMSDGWATLSPRHFEIDAIVPVPLHLRRQQERGFNHAALLARELGRRLQRPVVEDSLVRAKATAPQVGLDAQQRRDNVMDAFECMNDSLAGKSVLLIDDVRTTGSTLESACQALRDNGVSSVWAYTLARARNSEGSVVYESMRGI